MKDASFKANISIDDLVNYFNNSTGTYNYFYMMVLNFRSKQALIINYVFVGGGEEYKDVSDDDNEWFSTKYFPISKEGTILYLASVIFYQFMPLDDGNDKNKPKKKEIPIAPEWLFKKICPLVIYSLTR